MSISSEVRRERMTTTIPATKRQRWMLYVLSQDKSWWDRELTIQQASQEIARLKDAKVDTTSVRTTNYQRIWGEAIAAGMQALAACTPTPMIVQQHKDMLDDASPVDKQWFVEGGVCGFAWVSIKPATSSFARWLKEKGYAKVDGYAGGLCHWVRDGGQSMQRKLAYADAMAEVLRKYGITAHAMSRMD